MYASTARRASARASSKCRSAPTSRFPPTRFSMQSTRTTRLLFLTSPNNPTGLVDPARATSSQSRAPRRTRCVFVDEAYADFGGRVARSATPDIATLPNVLIGRTFAKAYGLAGLRAGAVVGDTTDARAAPAASCRRSASTSAPRSRSPAGLEDTEYYDWYLEPGARRRRPCSTARSNGSACASGASDANFVLADFGERARRVVDGPGGARRPRARQSRDPACPGASASRPGSSSTHEACIDALEEVLCGAA